MYTLKFDPKVEKVISANDRIIYNIYDQEVYVIIIALEGHYNDK